MCPWLLLIGDAIPRAFVRSHLNDACMSGPTGWKKQMMTKQLFRFSTIACAVVALCISPISKIAAANADPAFRVLATVSVPTNAQGCVAVNEVLNKFYSSGGVNTGDQVVVFDGMTFAGTNVGTGTCTNIDLKSDRYWSPTIYSGGIIVRNGRTNGVIATVPLSGCPIATSYDSTFNRVWVGAQCGNLNDPLYAIDATSFNVVAGPIGSGGVMGAVIANAANGRVYFTESGTSKRVNPVSFAVTTNAFGTVMATNARTNILYASSASGNNLQIINGAPDPEVIMSTVPLPFGPASMGVSQELGHLYLAYAAGVEVRDGQTGRLIGTFSLSPYGATPSGGMAVDTIRGRIYVAASTSSGPVIMVLEDVTTARNARSNNG